MGVWANGPSPLTVDVEGIAAVMRPTLEEWMTAQLRFFDPKRKTAPDYDPKADTGGRVDATMLFDTGPKGAIVQPIRSPSRVDVGGQANGLLGIRFQVKRPPVDVPMRGGLLVQVVNGGNAHIPSLWRFGLAEAIGSSFEWDAIYDATLITGG